MVRRSLRTRNIVGKKVRTPGGNTRLHFRRPYSATRYCAYCGKPVHGVSVRGGRGATSRRVSRPGGSLCSSCARNRLLTAVAVEWRL